jgi:hypothetical protein
MANISQHHKKTRLVAVAALVVGVLGLGVAFAALSTSLLISGTAKIKTASWSIYWNSNSCTATGEATVESTSISTTTADNDTANISAHFTANGDQVICTLVAKNAGTLNAKLSGYASSLTNLTNNNITAALAYAADTNNSTNGLTVGNTPTDNDKLDNNTTATMTLTLTYTGALVGQDSNALSFSYTLPYVQANQ